MTTAGALGTPLLSCADRSDHPAQPHRPFSDLWRVSAEGDLIEELQDLLALTVMRQPAEHLSSTGGPTSRPQRGIVEERHDRVSERHGIAR